MKKLLLILTAGLFLGLINLNGQTPEQSMSIDFGHKDYKFHVFTYSPTNTASNYTFGIACTAIDEYKISFMGSSVMNGQGAANMEGYAYLYDQLLQKRAAEGSSPFYRSNISIGGNTTVSVLNRFEKDLIGDCGKYVIFGLALGNEGVHETGQVAFDQYKENMQLLIQMARDAGKIPVVMNNYTRGDYTPSDYAFIKQMNLLIAQWDVPSTNMLGAVDDGSGRWAIGYEDDDFHPNSAGHAELFYAMVPSLFDALEAKKPMPSMVTGTYITPIGNGSIAFTPDNIIHPFTVSFDVQTTGTGNLMAFTTDASASGAIAIGANGHVQYTSPSGSTITGTVAVNDDEWHKITLTHFYARGETILYQDATAVGSLNEKLEAQTFSLHGMGAPTAINYRNWFFYRSGMNALEIEALSNGIMLKSSLELYAPLDGKGATGDDPYVNLAQSTNFLVPEDFVLAR